MMELFIIAEAQKKSRALTAYRGGTPARVGAGRTGGAGSLRRGSARRLGNRTGAKFGVVREGASRQQVAGALRRYGAKKLVRKTGGKLKRLV